MIRHENKARIEKTQEFDMTGHDKNLAFNDLPPIPPAEIDLETAEILKILSGASRQLGELNGLCSSLPDPQLLANFYRDRY